MHRSAPLGWLALAAAVPGISTAQAQQSAPPHEASTSAEQEAPDAAQDPPRQDASLAADESNDEPESGDTSDNTPARPGRGPWFADENEGPEPVYVDPPTAEPEATAKEAPEYDEPPLPTNGADVPPPPPNPKHRAPLTALWVGARTGWFVPFGHVWARGHADGPFLALEPVPWSDYASSGPMLEGNIGMRLARHYMVFGIWERAELGAGDLSGQVEGSTDFWGLGMRASSDPDRVGLITEIALGYRRFHSRFEDGTEVEFTNAPFEARVGIGADIRVSRALSLSPLLTLGAGSFGDIERVQADGTRVDETGRLDQPDNHAWLTLQIGAHFDLVPSHEDGGQ